MAASWIKVEVITPDKPEVFQLSEIMNLDPDAVLGKLVRLWAWADQQTIDGNANCNAASVTKKAIDRITFVSGFADALITVGWLVLDEGGLIFPNFERHNGNTSKNRAVTNRRVTKSRDLKRTNNAKCNGVSVTHTYQKPLPEEEEEEDIKDKTPHSAQVREGDFLPAFPMSEDWRPVGKQHEYTPAELEDFVLFWQSGRQEFNQDQWEQKFTRSVQRYREHAKTKKSGGLHAKQNTANASAFEQVRARHNEWRISQGLEPLGDDGGGLLPAVDPEERLRALDGLGPSDFEVLG